MICGVAETYLANIYVDNWFCKSDFYCSDQLLCKSGILSAKGKG